MVTYVSWHWGQQFPADVAQLANARGMTPQITWEPWDPRAGVQQSRYHLAGLARDSAYVDAFARGAARSGVPLTLRFGHEMNGDWYPWAVGVNGNTPADFVAAFRGLRKRFDEMGATNVRWVWCPNVMIGDQVELLRRCYPGDDVVDVVGLDGYDRDGNASPAQIFGDTVDVVRSIAPGKPVWINETGSTPGPNKAAYIEKVIDYTTSAQLDALVWFEVAAAGGPDWRLTENRQTRSAATRAFGRW